MIPRRHLPVLKLDMIQTVALAAVVLFVGYGIRRRVGVLDRFNIPAPVVGGFLFAAAALALRQAGVLAFEFDTALQTPLMVAFFTTIGLGASLGLLRIGGPQVLLFWLLASALAALQNGVGIGLAKLLGVDPLLGLITGSITMTGGHGTGAAFGQLPCKTGGVPLGACRGTRESLVSSEFALRLARPIRNSPQKLTHAHQQNLS